NDNDAFKVFAINAGLGTTEAVPIGGWLARLNKASGNKLTHAIREGSEEAIQEIFQQYGSNLAAKEFYDPERPWDQGLGVSGAAGFTLGSLMSLVVSAMGGRRARMTQRQPPLIDCDEIARQQPTGGIENAPEIRPQPSSDQPELPRTFPQLPAEGQDRNIAPGEQTGGEAANISDRVVQGAGQEAQVSPQELLSLRGANNEDLSAALQQYARQGAGFDPRRGVTVGLARGLRQQAGLKRWEDMTPAEQMREFQESAARNF